MSSAWEFFKIRKWLLWLNLKWQLLSLKHLIIMKKNLQKFDSTISIFFNIYASLKAPQDALDILRKIYFWNTDVAQSLTNFTCCMLDMISFT